jgi:hypothetical protein
LTEPNPVDRTESGPRVLFALGDWCLVCFVAEAGHTYAVIPRVAAVGVGQGLWLPRIADETVNAWVPSKSLKAEETACSLQPMGPVLRIAWPLGNGNIHSLTLDLFSRLTDFRPSTIISECAETHFGPEEKSQLAQS